jgi:hypothetical protein
LEPGQAALESLPFRIAFYLLEFRFQSIALLGVEKRPRGHQLLDFLQESGDLVADREIAELENPDERIPQSRAFGGP